MRISQIQLFGQVRWNFLILTLYSRIISSVLKVYDSSHFPFHWCLIRAWSIVSNKKNWIRNLHNIECFINPVEWKLHRPSIFMGSFSSLFLSKMDWKSFYSFPSCLTFFTMLKFIQVLPFVHARPFVNWCIFAWINARCHSEKKRNRKRSHRWDIILIDYFKWYLMELCPQLVK